MNKKTLIVVSAVLFTIFCFSPISSNAFHHNTRAKILDDAIHFSPDPLKSYLEGNYKIIAHGMFFADRHHRFRLDPYDIEGIYANLVNNLKAGKMDEYNTIHGFGVLASFVSQTIYPKRFNIQDEFAPAMVKYDGLHEVEDLNARISELITEYREPYYYSKHIKERDYLYNVAVNEIVDLWICAWKAAGKNTSNLCAVGMKIDRTIYFAEQIQSKAGGIAVHFHPGSPHDLAYIYDYERKVWVLVSGATRTVNGIPYSFDDETGILTAAGIPVPYHTAKN